MAKIRLNIETYHTTFGDSQVVVNGVALGEPVIDGTDYVWDDPAFATEDGAE